MIAYAFGYFAEAKLSFQQVEEMGGEEALDIARKGMKGLESHESTGKPPSGN